MAKFEVVISGMSGELPGCFIEDLETHAFTNENMIVKLNYDGSSKFPNYGGKTLSPIKCDNAYFGLHKNLLAVVNNKTISSLAKSVEALCDAGIHPSEIAMKNVGVVVASTCDDPCFAVFNRVSRYMILGEAKCMLGNRISYLLNTSGPSFYMDGGTIASFQALQLASSWVASGYSKYAIVGVDSAQSQPLMNYNYEGLKCLNWDGKTKSFSANADGYSRSCARVFFVLQRAQDAYKSYGTILNIRTSTELSRSYISDQVNFSNFLKDTYSELNINKDDIAYIEGDGSASLRVDAMELNSYRDVICADRKKPLLVGSCKSKFGHSMSAAGFVSVLNALIAFKTGYIPPTLHYSSPNPLVPALLDGRLKVVTEKTPLEGDLIGVTGMGLGSVYGHLILKRNPKTSQVKDKSGQDEELPRLFIISGRDAEAMNAILHKITNKPVDEYFYAINYKLFKQNFAQNFYRGYSLVSKNNKIAHVEHCSNPNKPIWFVCSGMGSQWLGMGAPFLKIPILRRSIQKCHDALAPHGIDLIHILTTFEVDTFDNILHAFVGIAAIQIALIDLLEELEVIPDGIVGHSTGEIGCAYADKCLTLEQAILSAYYRGKASNDAKLIKGMMAAVGKGYAEIKDDLPKEIEVACHNSSTSCTLTGPVDVMAEYVSSLKSRGVFAKLVNVADIAYHSQYVKPAAPLLLNHLKKLIPVPKMRSSKWISSSVPEKEWSRESAMYCSAEYLTNNLLNYVLFEEATAHVPEDALCIEIAPHGLLQAIVKKSLPTCSHVPLTRREKTDPSFIIEALGQLFMNGVSLDLRKLYPPVTLPAPRETDMMNVTTFDHSSENLTSQRLIEINYFCLAKDILFEKSKMSDKILLLYRIMDHFTGVATRETSGSSSRCFHFNNTHLLMEPEYVKSIRVSTLYQPGTGAIEVFNGDGFILTTNLSVLISTPAPFLTSEFVDKQLKLMTLAPNQMSSFCASYGLHFENQFGDVSSLTILKEGLSAKIKWRGNWDCYLKVLLDLISLYISLQMNRGMKINKIRELVYAPSEISQNHEDVEVYYSEHADYLCAKGVRIIGCKAKPLENQPTNKLNVQSLQFMPYSKLDSKINFANMCLQYFHENGSTEELILDLVVDKTSKLCRELVDIMTDEQISNKYKVYLRQKNRVTAFSQDIGLKTCFLVIGENSYQHHLEKLLSHNAPFYFIYFGKSIETSQPMPGEQLTPIIKQDNKGHTMVLYTQKDTALDNSVFVEMAIDDFGKKNETEFDNGLNKTYFLVYKYRYISDVINILNSSANSLAPNKRFVFIDEYSPPFDSNNEFYKAQLIKHLKINIAFGKKWGSIRDVIGESLSSMDSTNNENTLNDLRCDTVELNTLGLNVQTIMFPSRCNKLNVIEYSGVKEGKEIFGLAKITNGNILEVDPVLWWEKPKNWTFEEAATVPYYYSLAYDLFKKVELSLRPMTTVLILGGFSAFGQALITVAIKYGFEIFTTCHTQQQKAFLKSKYPQINEKYICIYDAYHRGLFQHVVMEATGGVGASVIVDTLEDETSRTETCHSVEKKGTYYLFTNKDQNEESSLGLSLVMTECKLQGYNPELILERSQAEKQTLVSLVQNGMKQNTVQPLDKHFISAELSTAEIEDAIVSESQNAVPRKTLVRITRSQKESQVIGKIFNQNKSFVIIGGYNDLWLEILSWLCCNGARNIHIILNPDEMTLCHKERLTEFRSKYKNANIELRGADYISSSQSCKNLIKGITQENSIDTVFFIKPGFEKELKCVDNALRLVSKDSCLVTVGLEACRVAEARRNDGLKGVSFTLKQGFLVKKKFADALRIWAEKLIDCSTDISIDLLNQPGMKENPADLLPLDICELMDLEENVDRNPSFVEITTKCPQLKFTPSLLPVILFPGLKIDKVKKFASQLMYPTYMARYPREIKSISALASSFSQMLVNNFDKNLFTLMAEGWSGALALTVARLLEEQGKQCLVLLLDADPYKLKNWNTISHSIIHEYISFDINRKNEEITANQLNKWSSKICEEIHQSENCHYNEEEINACFKILINRLDLVENYCISSLKLNSTVYLFSYDKPMEHLENLEKMFDSFNFCFVPRTSSSFLENPELIKSVNDLSLVEFKNSARKQNIKEQAVFCDIENDTILTDF